MSWLETPRRWLDALLSWLDASLIMLDTPRLVGGFPGLVGHSTVGSRLSLTAFYLLPQALHNRIAVIVFHEDGLSLVSN